MAGTTKPKFKNGREEVLTTAMDAVLGDRNLNYGNPEDNFQSIADLWNVQMGGKLAEGEKFTAKDVAFLMIQVKMGRLMNTPDHVDSLVDVAGYAACAKDASSSPQ